LSQLVALRSAVGRALGPLDWEAIREGQLRWWFLIPMTAYVRWNIYVLVESIFPLAPLLLASMVRWRARDARRRSGTSADDAAPPVAWCLPTPLPDWQTWSLQDVASRA